MKTTFFIVLAIFAFLLQGTNALAAPRPKIKAPKKNTVDVKSRTPASVKAKSRKRIIQFLDKPWVDPARANKSGTEGESAEDQSAAAKKGFDLSGLGGGLNGGSSSAKNGSPGARIDFLDSAKKGGIGSAKGGAGSGAANDDIGGGAGGGSDIGGVAAQGGAQQTTSTAKDFKKWYPMCLFFDTEAVPEATANKTVREMTEAAARDCQVNLIIFPVAVRPGSYPGAANQSGAVNDLQKQKCNLVDAKVGNAERSSTSMCVMSTQMSDHMCVQKCKPGQNPPDPECGTELSDHKKNTAGCAQLNASAAGVAEFDKKMAELRAKEADTNNPTEAAWAAARIKDIEGHNKGGGGKATSDKVAPSIEDYGACDAETVSHEAIGHSQFGHPNGKEDGMGIGFDDRVGPSGTMWSDTGCAAFRLNAFDNDGRWKYDAQRTTYVTYPAQENQYDLINDPPLFKAQNAPPDVAASKPPPPIVSGPPIKTVEVMDGDFFKNKSTTKPSEVSSSPPGPPPVPSSDDPRHRRKAGDVIDGLLSGIRGRGGPKAVVPPDDPIASSTERPSPPPPNDKAKASPRIGFNDDAPKGVIKESAGGKTGERSGDASYATGGDSGGAAISFDDDAPKGGYGPARNVASTPNGGSVVMPGAKVGFNDDAPKGGVGSVSATPREGGAAFSGNVLDEPNKNGISGATIIGAPASAGSAIFSADFFKEIGSNAEKEEEIRNKKRGDGSRARSADEPRSSKRESNGEGRRR